MAESPRSPAPSGPGPAGSATGVGSMPGDDLAETLRMVLGEVPDLPFLPELPHRSAAAGMTGRGVAVLAELGADLQPAGWRLTDAPGRDHRRARSLLAQDLDVLEEQAEGYEGWLKVQVAGPWTLAATVERPRGDRLLADHGARRDLGQSLAEGLAAHVDDVQRRVPGARVVVQVDEPALPSVLAGAVPTASGFGRHRSIAAAEATETLRGVLAAVGSAGAVPVVHCCADDVPLDLLCRAGARAASVDLARVRRDEYDGYATLLERGVGLWLGVVPTAEPTPEPRDGEVVRRVQRFFDDLGVDPEVAGPATVTTPACGLAGASAGWARRALALARRTADGLSARSGRMGA